MEKKNKCILSYNSQRTSNKMQQFIKIFISYLISVVARFSAPIQTGPGAHPASCTMGTRSFPGVKSSLGVTLTPHPLLVPWS